MTPDQCPRVGRLIRGCRWEGRYSVSDPAGRPGDWVIITGLTGKVPTERKSVYVRDVCRTCGAVKEREPK